MTYDPQFREKFTDLEKADFTHIDQTLYSRSLWTASAVGIQRPVTPAISEHTLPPRGKRKKSKCAMPGTMGKCALFSHAAMHTYAPSAGETTGDRPVCRQLTLLGDQ